MNQSQDLIVSIDEDHLLYIINRYNRGLIRKIEDGFCLGAVCLRKRMSLEGENEFILVRDEEGVNVIDLENGQYK